MSDTAKRMWSKNDITSIAEEDYVKKTYAQEGQQLVYLSSYNNPNDSAFVDFGNTAYTFPRRNDKSNIKVGTATDDTDAVNKKYAEDNFIPIKQITGGDFQIPQVGYNKEIYWLPSNVYASDNSIAQRYTDGRLRVTNPVEDSDAVNKGSLKTIFGNQSLVGSGNIDLYEHDITVTKSNGKAYLTIYSSVNTPVDSLNDLKAITKNDTFTKSATGYIGSKIVVAITELNLLLADGTTELLTNTTFNDVVTTI